LGLGKGVNHRREVPLGFLARNPGPNQGLDTSLEMAVAYRVLRAGGAPELPEAEHGICSPSLLWTYATLLADSKGAGAQ
jgi:hypothetical protein